MKRFLAMMLTAVMAVSLAACGGKTNDVPEVQDEAKNNGVTSLHLYQVDKMDSEWGLCTAKWQDIWLTAEDAAVYPALAAALENMNIEQDVYHSDWAYQAKADAQEAKDAQEEFWSPFENTSEYYVQRADDRILSVREDFYEYCGGVHGMYGTIGHVFDTQTGERMALSDVISDTDVIPMILAEKLVEKYPGDIYNPADVLAETLAEYKLEDFRWTVDYQGITFYFDPYELASYAAGRLTATIWFDEHPELFDEALMEQPADGYIKEIPVGDAVEVDLNRSDDQTDKVYVYAFPLSEYGEQQLNVYKNGVTFTDEDSYGYAFQLYLACRNDTFCVIAESTADNDYSTMTVYDLQDEITVSDVLEGTEAHYPREEQFDSDYDARIVLNDPSEMCLDTMVYLLGTMVGTDTYELLDGKLDKDNIYYTLPETMQPLVSKVPLEVYVPEAEEMEEIPAGTEFHFLRTDNESYVDMKMDDGRDCRVYVEFDGWGRTVNGISEYDAFDGILYAG